jgi:M6 family metalloprotease-like protein
LHGQVQENATSAGSIRGQAAQALAQRAAALQTLIQEDPYAALTFAFSRDLLSDLAAKFPGSAAVLESHVTLSGTVEHRIADSADLRSSKESWFLNAGGRRLELYFGTPQRPGSNSGPTATIEGVQLGSQVAVSKVNPSSPAGSSVIPNRILTTGNLSASLALLSLSFVFASARKILRSIHSLIASRHPPVFRFAVCAVALFVAVGNPITASAQNTCGTTGVQNIAVLLVSFSDTPVAVTPATASNIFFGNDGGVSLNGYWQEASYGQTSATGNVLPLTIGPEANYSCTNNNQIFFDAVTAAKNAGIELTAYQRINVIFPSLGCFWAGITSTSNIGAGCENWSTAEGTLTASLSMLQDAYFGSRNQGLSLVTHENGHQLTLGHSGTMSYEPTAVLPPNGVLTGITSTDMNDDFSTMGNWVTGHYVAQHKAEFLNWLSLGNTYQSVQSGGTYTLQPLETSPAGLKALKVLRGTGNTGYYVWIEYRQPVGNYDSTIGFMNFNGASIHFEFPTDGDHSYVTDFTPSDVGTWYNTVLAPGQTWTDAYTDLSISVVTATSTGLIVSVSYSGSTSSCISSVPTVSLSPANPSLSAGQSTGYAASITDNDSSACSSTTFNLASSEPSGWTTSFSASSVTLSPGQTTSVTMTKGAPSGTAAGTYAVNLAASDSTTSATANANATVATPPSLAINASVSGTNFVPPATVPITATVLSGGLPASGASVTFTLAGPNGNTTKQSATTGSNGVATWNYKVSSKAPAGNYSVVAQANLNSSSTGGKRVAAAGTLAVSSNTATFSVQ